MFKILRYAILSILIILVITVAAVFVFGPNLVKQKLEPALSEANGAEVNIKGISMSLFPIGFTVDQVAMTNPNKPSENVVSIAKLDADLAVMPLLNGTFQIDNLLVDNVHFSSPRAKPGKVLKKPESKETMSFADIKQDIKNSIQSENLITVQRYQTLNKNREQQQQQVEKAVSKLPTKEKMVEYKQRIEALKKQSSAKNITKLAELKEQLASLHKDIKSDRLAIKQARQTIGTAKEVIKSDFKSLKDGPDADWQQLSSKYEVNKIAELMLGAEQTAWIKGLLEPSDEENVADIDKTAATFIIKQGQINMQWMQSKIAIDLQDVTLDNYLTQQKSRWNIRSLSEHIKAEGGGWFFMNQEGADSQNLWDLSGLPLEELAINQSDEMKVLLKAAKMASKGNFSMEKGQVNADFAINLLQPLFELEGVESWVEPLEKALNQNDNIDFNYLLKTENKQLLSKVRSNIDKMVTEIVKQSAKGEVDAYKQEYIDQLKSKYLQGSDVGKMFDTDLQGLDQMDQQLESLLKEKLSKGDLLKGLFG
jgi:hypothetical protein